MTRVLLLDDHPAVAEGMRELLSREPGIEVVAVAGAGEQAIELARVERPEVALLDIDLPIQDGLEIGQRLLAELPELHLIYFSMYANPVFVLRAIALGAKGYLLKEEPASEVASGIRAVATGGHCFSEPIRQIAQAMGRSSKGVLSDRERAVMKLMALGRNLAEVAEELGITRGTVRALWTRAQHKLGLRSLGVGLFTASLGSKERG
jgi:two-component system response regulator DesR